MRDVPKRMVFVDGDENTRLVVKMIYERLEEQDEETVMVTCSSGEELLLRLRIVEPDLVIIGQNLEGFDSLQTFMALRDREEGRSMPVIFLTGRDELAMIEDHTKPGISGVIYKPFETGMLPQMINDIWSGLLAEHNKNPEPGLKKGCGIFTHG